MTAITAVGFTHPAIPATRAKQLFRWNASLAVLHGVQFVVMLALSLAQEPMASWPVISSYLVFEPATQTLVSEARTLFEVPIGLVVASFFAFDHVIEV